MAPSLSTTALLSASCSHQSSQMGTFSQKGLTSGEAFGSLLCSSIFSTWSVHVYRSWMWEGSTAWALCAAMHVSSVRMIAPLTSFPSRGAGAWESNSLSSLAFVCLVSRASRLLPHGLCRVLSWRTLPCLLLWAGPSFPLPSLQSCPA